jgi:hypothetical protein
VKKRTYTRPLAWWEKPVTFVQKRLKKRIEKKRAARFNKELKRTTTADYYFPEGKTVTRQMYRYANAAESWTDVCRRKMPSAFERIPTL